MFIFKLLSHIFKRLNFLIFLILFPYGICRPVKNAEDDVIDKENVPSVCIFQNFDQQNPEHFVSVSQRKNDCGGSLLSLRKIFDDEVVDSKKLYGAENVIDLMLSRSGKLDTNWKDDDSVNELLNGVVCQNHYDELYSNWHQNKYKHVKYRTQGKGTVAKCSWPDSHLGNPTKFIYHVTKNDARSLFINQKKIYPVGLPVCQEHKEFIQNEAEDAFSDVENDPPYCDAGDNNDVSTSVIVSSFAKELGIKRVKTQCDFNELADRTKRDKIQNAKQLVDKIIDVFAPKAEKLLKKKICEEYVEENESKEASAILKDVAEQYAKAEGDKRLRRYALSVVANVIPFETIQRYIPKLTQHAYYEARKVKKAETLIAEPLRRYERYDKTKIKKFIDFITGPAVLISLPYGQKIAKLSDKTKINIPNTVRLQRHAEIISMFNASMIDKGEGHNVLPRSTLFSILHHAYATRSKALTCVDYFLSNGMEAFDQLKKIIKDWQQKRQINFMVAEDLSERLQNGRLYLRTDFRVNLKEHSPVVSHCMNFALSTSDPSFHKSCPANPPHTVICERCQSLQNVLDEIKNLAIGFVNSCTDNGDCTADEAAERAVTNRLVEDAVFDIFEMKSHILRAAYSDMQKNKIVKNLDDDTAFLTMDWAQKFQPMKFAESQREYFGKTGIAWHLSVASVKVNGIYGDHSYLHIIDGSKQDTSAVIAIMGDVLKQLARMGVKKVILRSDNAPCYHSKEMFFSLKALQQQTNVQILQWAFSEPQAGKASCDLKAAEVKNFLRAFVDKRNNVETSQQFFDAIANKMDYTTVSLSTIQRPKSTQKIYTIPGISRYYDFIVEENGIRVFHFNGIGVGKVHLYSKYGEVKPESLPTLVIKSMDNILDKLTPPNKASEILALQNNKYTRYWRTETKINRDLQLHGQFSCPEEECGLTFETNLELQQHLISDIHQPRLPEMLTMMDYALLSYKEAIDDLKNDQLQSIENSIRDMVVHQDQLNDISSVKEGWAHQIKRFNPKKTDSAKNFLKKLFNEGSTPGGKKYTGFEAANAMVEAKTPDGRRIFKAEELLRADQIASYFSTLSKDAKSGSSKTPKKPKITVTQPQEADDDSDEFEPEDEEVIIVEDEDSGARVLRRSQRLARNALQHQLEEEVDEMYRNVERLIN